MKIGTNLKKNDHIFKFYNILRGNKEKYIILFFQHKIIFFTNLSYKKIVLKAQNLSFPILNFNALLLVNI